MNGHREDRDIGSPDAVVIAVRDDVVDELVDAGLVEEMPTLRGPVLDAVVNIGVNSAALVTLMQTPHTVRAFAAWLVGRTSKDRDVISVTAKRGGRQMELKVTGDVSVDAVASFLTAAFEGSVPEPAGPTVHSDDKPE